MYLTTNHIYRFKSLSSGCHSGGGTAARQRFPGKGAAFGFSGWHAPRGKKKQNAAREIKKYYVGNYLILVYINE